MRLKELETEAEALAGRKFNLGSNAQVGGFGPGSSTEQGIARCLVPPACISTCLPACSPVCPLLLPACLAWVTLQVRRLLFDQLGIQKPPCATVGNGVSTRVSEPSRTTLPFTSCLPGGHRHLPPH